MQGRTQTFQQAVLPGNTDCCGSSHTFWKRVLTYGSIGAHLLEESVDAWDAAVPGVIQIIQRQPPVLCCGLRLFQRILTPHALAVDELALPRLQAGGETKNWG
eukprot:1160813-Pelagomonas_calceolata.AAC.1